MTGTAENLVLILFAVTMLWVAASSRLELYARMLGWQGVLLFVVALGNIAPEEKFTLAFVAVETLLLKGLVIPMYLIRVIRRNEIRRETEPYLPNLYSLAVAVGLTAVGFVLAFLVRLGHHPVHPCLFGAAVAVILNALFILLTRKKFITHIIAFVFLENGIFLLSLAVAGEMPFVVNLGVMLDVFMWVLLAGVFVRTMKDAIPGQHIDKLRGLRG
ncbi:MAG: hypothetical protein PHQ27_00435 [Victivallales bacterium]|nr:hypothetical protein [Victivallales bacterium]